MDFFTGVDFGELEDQFTGANEAIDNMRNRADMYADSTSHIYTDARNMLTKGAQENAVLQAMQYLRKLNQGGQIPQHSGVVDQNVNQIYTQNLTGAVDNMSKIYQQGQATADSIYANTMNADMQVANVLSGLKFDTQKLHYDRQMDFLTGIMALNPFKWG
tara:strand:- start:734 stop:1213 length:480 start_codon:yes stop_codon:yes gene_type:complete